MDLSIEMRLEKVPVLFCPANYQGIDALDSGQFPEYPEEYLLTE